MRVTAKKDGPGWAVVVIINGRRYEQWSRGGKREAIADAIAYAEQSAGRAQ